MLRFLRFLQQVYESFWFAWQALSSNLLRTTLSLLGVTIGIFAIITVFTIVDALNRSVRSAMSFIGKDVIYVQRFPWAFGDSDYPWWRYFARPSNTVQEFKYLERMAEKASAVTLIAGKAGLTIKRDNFKYDGAYLQATSFDYLKITDFVIAQGRFFSETEVDNAREVAILGAEIAEVLFPNSDPVGQTIKVRSRPFTVVGVFKKEGANIFGESSADKRVVVPYGAFSKLYRLGRKGIEPLIAIKGYPDDKGLVNVEGEIRGLLRAKRALKPYQEDNFALNRSELFTQFLNAIYGALWLGGAVIGGFSILVGGFGIANIMFVSVKERTNLIGIQKSLGAKNYFILFQFLFEAVLLSLVGGLVGLLLVYLITFIPLGSLQLMLSSSNVVYGLATAVLIGVVSGVIPAWTAAQLDPVEAIRAK